MLLGSAWLKDPLKNGCAPQRSKCSHGDDLFGEDLILTSLPCGGSSSGSPPPVAALTPLNEADRYIVVVVSKC